MDDLLTTDHFGHLCINGRNSALHLQMSRPTSSTLPSDGDRFFPFYTPERGKIPSTIKLPCAELQRDDFQTSKMLVLRENTSVCGLFVDKEDVKTSKPHVSITPQKQTHGTIFNVTVFDAYNMCKKKCSSCVHLLHFVTLQCDKATSTIQLHPDLVRMICLCRL